MLTFSAVSLVSLEAVGASRGNGAGASFFFLLKMPPKSFFANVLFCRWSGRFGCGGRGGFDDRGKVGIRIGGMTGEYG